MHHIVVIVGSYDQHWRHFPIVGRQGADRLFLFVDHRNSVAERQSALAEHVNISDVASMDIYYTSPVPACTEGTHPWDPIEGPDGAMIAVRCPRCGRTDPLPEPCPGKIGTLQRLLASV